MHIRNFEIQKFRGINHSVIKNLGKRVNLFIGKNNCGKSSVLDALYLLFSAYKPQITVDINSFRDHVYNNLHDTVAVNFNSLDFNNIIELKSFEGNNFQRVRIYPKFDDDTEVSFENIYDSKIGSEEKKVIGLRINSIVKINEDTKEFDAFLIETNDSNNIKKSLTAKVEVPDKIALEAEVKYISAKTPFVLDYKIIEGIIVNKEQPILLDALRLIDSRITNISVLKNRVYIDMVGIDKLMPVEVLGDGVRRTINIISNLFKCRNGILLVDEFDNGIHFSSLPVIWKAIIHATDKFNVQLFVTTHNIDSLKTLKLVADDLNPEIQNQIKCIKLEHKTDNDLIAYNYNFDEFSYAIDMEHEIR